MKNVMMEIMILEMAAITADMNYIFHAQGNQGFSRYARNALQTAKNVIYLINHA